jgi:aspartyl-tRNA(Asn)/glutamyl-tRNA(Gln) amidotransferase subunit C
MLRMTITLDEVRHVARLARLELDDDELGVFLNELNALLGHFEDVRRGSAGLAWQATPGLRANVWADDEPMEGLSHTEAMRNSPLSRAGFFIVPSVLED